MVFQHFGLREEPFGVTPDPRFLYNSESHRQALASLIDSIDRERGFSFLIGEPGLGKTTLLYHLLERYSAHSRTAFVFFGMFQSRELIRHILADFGIPTPENDTNAMFGAFRDMLQSETRAGRHVILFLDEAQALSPAALNTVRLLSNFEATNSKRLHIVLAGQPQLSDTLQDPDLASLQQRIATLARLRSFTAAEVDDYIEHRLQMAGGRSTSIFTRDAVDLIARHSQGIPREINRLAANAMAIAFALNSSRVEEDVVQEVIGDLHAGETHEPEQPRASQDEAHSKLRPLAAKTSSVATQTWGSQALAFSPALEEQVRPMESPLQWPSKEIPLDDSLGALRSELRELPQELPARRSHRTTLAASLVVAVAISIGGLLVVKRGLRATEHAATAPAATELAPATPAPEHQSDAPHSLAQASRNRRSKRSANGSSLHPPSPRGAVERELPPPTLNEKSADEIQPLVPPTMPNNSTSAGRSGTMSSPSKIVAANGSASEASRDRSASTGTQVTPAMVRFRVEPVYPPAAKAQRVEGSVDLQVHLDRAGHVIGITVLSGDGQLAAAAKDAVRKWEFSPVLENGNPTEGYTKVKVQFTARK